jgi:hypothetical protein
MGDGLYSEASGFTRISNGIGQKCMNGLMYPHFIAARAFAKRDVRCVCEHGSNWWIARTKTYNNHEITQAL